MLMKLDVSDSISLDQLSDKDAVEIFNAIDQQRTYLGQWLPFVAFTKKLEDTQAFISSVMKLPESEREYTFIIRENNVFAGIIGFKCTDKANRRTEIGYWLREEFQGRGIMTKCVAKLCAFAFTQLVMNRIQIKCAVGNTPSRKIPQRLNFTFEGIEREGERFNEYRYFDLEVYSKLKAD